MADCVVSVSGGMDSSTLLLRAIDMYDSVTAISFDYGQKHKVELERVVSLVSYLKEKGYEILHQIIKIEGLANLLESTLVEGGKEVPEGHYEQENMKDTVVPNRNKIFSSIIQAVALSITKKTGERCDIALGIHKGDHLIYPDTTQEFRDADEYAFRKGNWDTNNVRYYTPYLDGDKYDILRDGQRLCKILKLDFNEVYRRTNTSYKPLQIDGKWYSDYKSASSVERILAFIELGEADPVDYADEIGPIIWEVARDHALEVEKKFKGI